MVHQNWLLFSLASLLSSVTGANDGVIITATLTQNSDLDKCHSCLTDIAGVDRLSVASDPTHDPNH